MGAAAFRALDGSMIFPDDDRYELINDRLISKDGEGGAALTAPFFGRHRA